MTTEANVRPVNVRVTEYRIARIKAGQAIVPLAVLSSIVARRWLHPVAVAVAVVVLVAGLLSFFSARRALGRQPFRVQDGSAVFGTRITLTRKRVLRWTLGANVIRLYCADISLRLVCDSDDRHQLVQSLTAWLGRPIQLERRGSQQARMLAIFAAAAGLACTVAAFAFETIALVVIGLPVFIIGLATFGALSQRIARL